MSFRTQFSASMPISAVSAFDTPHKKETPQSPSASIAKQAFENASSSTPTQKAARQWSYKKTLLATAITLLGGGLLLGARYFLNVTPPSTPKEQIWDYVGAGKFQQAHDFLSTISDPVKKTEALQELVRASAVQSLPEALKASLALINHTPAHPASFKEICPPLTSAIAEQQKTPTTLAQLFDLSHQNLSTNDKNRFFAALVTNCIIKDGLYENGELSLLADMLTQMADQDIGTTIDDFIKRNPKPDQQLLELTKQMYSKGINLDKALAMGERISDSEIHLSLHKHLILQQQSAEGVIAIVHKLSDPSDLYGLVLSLLTHNHLSKEQPLLPIEEERKLLGLLQNKFLKPEELADLVTATLNSLDLPEAVKYFQGLSISLTGSELSDPEAQSNQGIDALIYEIGENLMSQAREKGQEKTAFEIWKYLPNTVFVGFGSGKLSQKKSDLEEFINSKDVEVAVEAIRFLSKDDPSRDNVIKNLIKKGHCDAALSLNHDLPPHSALPSSSNDGSTDQAFGFFPPEILKQLFKQCQNLSLEQQWPLVLQAIHYQHEYSPLYTYDREEIVEMFVNRCLKAGSITLAKQAAEMLSCSDIPNEGLTKKVYQRCVEIKEKICKAVGNCNSPALIT